MIEFQNKINRFLDRIINNRFSNFLKEFFEIGMDYPAFFYCDSTKEYLYRYKYDGREIEATLSDNINYALDVNKINKIERWILRRNLNKMFNGEKYFRYKRLLTWN